MNVPRMVGPRDVMRALSCGRSAAYSVMTRLGGANVPGVGWRVSERELVKASADQSPFYVCGECWDTVMGED